MILYRIDMSDTIDYIDDYFTGALSDSERSEFEARCSSDEIFASEVAFYVSARHKVRDVLLAQKKENWTQKDATIQTMKVAQPSKKSGIVKWISYAAAACVIFILAAYFLFLQPTPQRLAARYINNIKLGQMMDASHDSLHTGIAYLQVNDYQKALIVFEDLRKRDSTNDEAKQYAGYTYLQLHNYNKALECFQELSAMKSLESNKGDIMQAATLLERDAPGDEEAAKIWLEKVVREDEEGSKEAKEMLAVW